MPNKQYRMRWIPGFLMPFLVSAGLLMPACGSSGDEQGGFIDARLFSELEEANKALLEIENQEILDFIERYGWDTRETGSGLRYFIFQHGEGLHARRGQLAVVEYKISLLTGDLVYSSKEEGPLSFQIGRGGVESGLEEGILLMREGDRAKLIMPAHLAHGVPGDGDRIPKRAAIVYDVELIRLLDP
jgi:FKBP-type peptidyl-prolyl cis-trans isomerase FkpA